MVLDCETAALQQGLAYYGINVTQAELFATHWVERTLFEANFADFNIMAVILQ
jgi:hypothetical protein